MWKRNVCPFDPRGAANYNEQLKIPIHIDVQYRPIENIESDAKLNKMICVLNNF